MSDSLTVLTQWNDAACLLCNRKGKPVILVTERNNLYSCFGEQEVWCALVCQQVWLCRADLEAWHLSKAAQLLPGSVLQPVGGRVGDGARIT